MKPKFGREIALLSLPIVILGGVALWNGRGGAWSGWGVPRGLSEGQPRLEITDWKPETPTALDFARGISSRWTVTTWGGGACPADGKPPRYGGMEYPKTLFFAWKRAGKWHQTPFRYGPSELDVQNFGVREKPTSNKVHLGLPMDLVPRDADEVCLRGRLDGWMMCQSGSVAAPGAPLDISLKKSGEAWPVFAGSRATVLKFVTAEQAWSSLMGRTPSRKPYWEINSAFSYAGKADQTRIDDERTWVEDAKGKWVVDVTSSSSGSYQGGISSPIWRVDTRQLKAHQSPFTLKSWVYVDEDEWPLQISIPLTLGKPFRAVR